MSLTHPIITSADVKQNHTPGPWAENGCEIQAADGSAVCEMLARPEDADKWGHHHADANSRLIAAAPDLLAALESIVSLDLCCATLEEKRKADAVFAAARAAITQATGGAK
jgi:hypothetical protein